MIDALSAALRRDTSPKVRATAAWALGSIGDDEAVDALTAALSDTSRSVRMRAVWAIGSIEPKQAPEGTGRPPGGQGPEVRSSRHGRCSHPGSRRGPGARRGDAEGDGRDTQRAMIRALASTGEKSVDAIKELIDSKDPRCGEAAIRALAGGGSSGPWPWPWPEPRPFP